MRRAQLMASSLLLVLLLSACGPRPAPAPQAPAAPAKAAWEGEWDKVVAAAKQEGQLTWGTTGGDDVRRDLSAAFNDRYKTEVQSVAAGGGDLGAKILAERRAGIYLWDIVLTAGSTAISIFKPANSTSPLEPALILPDLTDPEAIKKVWYGGKLPWIDRDRHVLGALLTSVKQLAINTDLVKAEEMKSWDDLLNPKWKGKILMLDPTNPGVPIGRTLMPVFYAVKGEDWLRKLAAQEPVLIRDDRLATDWLAHGKYPIRVGVEEGTIREFVKAGAPIAYAVTRDVEPLGAGPSGVILIDRAPHPNAAKVFINWYLSKEGQTLMSKVREGQSARLDVPTDFLAPEAIRVPGPNYWFKDSEEVLLKINDYFVKSKEIFGHLVK